MAKHTLEETIICNPKLLDLSEADIWDILQRKIAEKLTQYLLENESEEYTVRIHKSIRTIADYSMTRKAISLKLEITPMDEVSNE